MLIAIRPLTELTKAGQRHVALCPSALLKDSPDYTEKAQACSHVYAQNWFTRLSHTVTHTRISMWLACARNGLLC